MNALIKLKKLKIFNARNVTTRHKLLGIMISQYKNDRKIINDFPLC